MSVMVSGCCVYPVKACRGISYHRVEIDARGIVYDREWMIVDGDGAMRAQRAHPMLARIGTKIEHEALRLDAPGMEDLRIALHHPPHEQREVVIGRDHVTALDEGDAAAAWCSEVVGAPCRIVRIAPDDQRASASGSARVRFQYAYPILAISEASLRDLNRRIIDRGGVPVPMGRFRPNIVLSGCGAYAEDTWGKVRIGDVEFVGRTSCARCVTTTIDQATGARDPQQEPLRTLAAYRTTPDGVMFGRNMTHQGRGIVQVGNRVDIIASIVE